MTPNEIVNRYDDVIVNILNTMYNDLQNNYLPVDLDEENIIRIDGIEYQVISF